MKHPDRISPRAIIPEAIDLCKANITQFLKDAKLLIDNSTLSHAYISVQFAIEELGKILIIREKLAKDTSDPLIIKHEEAFKSHKGKTEKAIQFLGNEFSKIYDEGFWQDEFFEKGFFKQNTYANHETRCDCAFVDYYASRWRIGRDIKKDLLIKLIKRIEEKLPEA